MRVTFGLARPSDAASIAALRNAAADLLTQRFGKGHWSGQTSERGVLTALDRGRLFVGRAGRRIVGVAGLGTRKPWAIDLSYFSPSRCAVYLTGMAVAPDWQGKGIGRRLVEHSAKAVAGWPGDSIRLDAYDAPAGAGAFYAKCGFAERGRAKYRGIPLIYYELLLPGRKVAKPASRLGPAKPRRVSKRPRSRSG